MNPSIPIAAVIEFEQLNDVVGESRIFTLKADCALLDVKEMFEAKNVDTIPIMDNAGNFVGIIEQRSIEKYFRKKVLELREKISLLERPAVETAKA